MDFLISRIYAIMVGLIFGIGYSFIEARFARKNQGNKFVWGLIINCLLCVNFELFTRPFVVALFK